MRLGISFNTAARREGRGGSAVGPQFLNERPSGSFLISVANDEVSSSTNGDGVSDGHEVRFLGEAAGIGLLDHQIGIEIDK